MTIRDNGYCFRILVYSYCITITGWGGPPKVHLRQGGLDFGGIQVSNVLY